MRAASRRRRAQSVSVCPDAVPAGRWASVKPCSMPSGPAAYHSRMPERASDTRLPLAVTASAAPKPARDSESVLPPVRRRLGSPPRKSARTPPPARPHPEPVRRAAKARLSAAIVEDMTDCAWSGNDCSRLRPALVAGAVGPLVAGSGRCVANASASAASPANPSAASAARTSNSLIPGICVPRSLRSSVLILAGVAENFQAPWC